PLLFCYFFLMTLRPLRSTLFPYTTLFRSHLARQFGTTYSLVQGEPTVACVLSAIRKHQVQIVSHPLTLRAMTLIAAEIGLRDGWHRAKAALRPGLSPPERVHDALHLH